VDGITCDMCGKSLLVDEEVRYVADVRVYAAYDPMELTTRDLEARDVRAEIERTLETLEGVGEIEAQEEVYATRRLDLCPSCRKLFLDDPLARSARGGSRDRKES
jgi:hypothetical protein